MIKRSLILLISLSLMILVSCVSIDQTTSNDEEPINKTEDNDVVVETNEANNTSFINEDENTNETGMIYLYGEAHYVEEVLEKELEIWGDYYNKGMRHLFIESPYFEAQLLNLWLKDDSDEYLDYILSRYQPFTHEKNIEVKRNFYSVIKENYPETVFHGTDVGHGHYNIGQKYMIYLMNNDLEDTKEYKLAREAIEQGQEFSKHHDPVYRESKMVENFTREFESLDGESVMGIYGVLHTDLNNVFGEVNNISVMAVQLHDKYGERLISENLTYETTDYILNGKTYKAKHCYYVHLLPGRFGIEAEGFDDMIGYEQWQILDAYDDFSDKPTWNVFSGDFIQERKIEGSIYVMEITRVDGSVERFYVRFDKGISDDYIYAVTFTLEDMPIVEPKAEIISVKDQEYKALNYGTRTISGLMGIESMTYYHLKDAYETFKDLPKHHSKVQPVTSYPLIVEEEQVYLIELTMTDGEVIREYYISSGDNLVTEGLILE